MRPLIVPAGAVKAQPPPPAAALDDVTAPANHHNHQHGKGEEEEEEKEETATTRDLDSGRAWLILLIMFLLQSSISGASRVYGIVYAREVATGYYDREQAAWPIATASAVENLAGILTPALGQWLSWRQMELASTSLLVTANLLAWTSDSLWLDVLALGLVQGLALSTCTVLSLVINNDYFDRYRTTAYGLQMSGSTFGVLYLGPLVTWILETFPGPTNFRLVYLALACVFALNLPLVLLIRPRVNRAAKVSKQEQEPPAQPQTGGYGVSASRKVSRFESHFERKSSVASVSYGARSRRQSILSRVVVAPLHEAPSLAEQGKFPTAAGLAKSQSGVELARANSRAAQELWAREALRKKISLGSMRAGPPRSRGPSVASRGGGSQTPDSAVAATLSHQVSSSRQAQLVPVDAQQQAFYLELAAAAADGDDATSLASCQTTAGAPETSSLVELDLGLFKRLALEREGSVEWLPLPGALTKPEVDSAQTKSTKQPDDHDDGESFSWQLVRRLLSLPYLHCTWIMLALYYLIARVLVIILVDFARDHGSSLADATQLLNCWSLGELLGRVLLGSLIDLKFLSCRTCIALTCATLAALLALMALVESYLLYAVCSLLIAALVSLEYMLINVMMVEYLGKARVTSCYSLAACLCSLVLFARPTLIGLFRDQLGSYDGLLLLLAGLAGTFALLFWALEPLFVRRWPRCSS